MSSHHHHHHPQHQQQQEYHHQQREREHEHEHENVFVFPSNNGFDRSIGLTQQQQQQDEIPNKTQTQTPNENNVYETSGMLSEMFNFGPAANTPAEIFDYRRAGMPTHWVQQHQSHSDSAASMQLFLTNAPPRSPSPPPPQTSSSTLHMLLPSPPNALQPPPPSGFHPLGNHQHTNPNPNLWGPELGGIIEGQGLSLSLSSSLQHTEDHNSLFFKSLAGPSHQPILHNLQEVGAAFGSGQGSNMVFESASSSLGVVNVLRTSKYAKAAQELLEEFCSVGRGHLKKTNKSSNPNPNPNNSSEGGGGSSLTKEATPRPPLSPADRIEHQRRKVKLLSMLDEVERRYSHYCEQMQMVVNSFDMVMGYGAAVPYTALAQKAMSRHFRCLKDAIQAELRLSCELIGEKDPTGSTGLTKGETPRLKMLEHNLRQQRAFHQTMGLMDHSEAWRPQRGLPERSVTILRAWLFEHFLHPYPSDADKHLLARQTGLSRNQVSNWFINARVRLWKPMIEEMYQQESKEDEDEEEEEEEEEEDEEEEDRDRDKKQTSTSSDNSNLITTATQQQNEAQNPMPSSSSSVSAPHNNINTETMTPVVAPPHHHTDSSLLAINTRHRHHQPPPPPNAFYEQHFGEATTMIRFGTAGDVSLTLGLRHAGNNAPDKTPAFSLRDFGSC